MKVRMSKLKTLTNDLVKPDPIHQEEYPQPRNKDLPKCFFLAGIAGARGSGKTALTIRLLKDYEDCGFTCNGKKVPQVIKLISPTSESNPAFKKLKHLDKADIHENYTDALLLKLMEEIKADRMATKKYKQAMHLWKIFQTLLAKDKDPYFLMNKEDLALLAGMTNGFKDDPMKPAHPDGRVVHLVLDDCVGSPCFRLSRNNAFSGFTLNSRHYWTNIVLLSQRAKQIPPIIRSNLSLVAIFRTMSEKLLLEEVFPIVDALVSEEQFLALYDVATQENKYDCLLIDTMAEKGKEFRKNLNQVLQLV